MIRKFREEDTDAVVSVWKSATSLAHPFLSDDFVAQEEVNLRTLHLPNAETWVLEDHAGTVGFIALLGNEIGGLFLDPALHGRGLGRAMVDHAVALKGPLRVEVFEKNAIGRRFYERYGFVWDSSYRHDASGEMTLKLVMPAR